MTTIIAARFETWDSAADAERALVRQGLMPTACHTFYVNAPGAHDQFPVGGDQTADPDAKGAQFGAVAGAAVLGASGAALFGLLSLTFGASFYIVLIAAGIGAYLGSLMGALRVAGKRRFHALVNPFGAAFRATAAPAVKQPVQDVGAGQSRTAAADIEAGFTPLRHAGVLLAVNAGAADPVSVAGTLRNAGGVDIERADGNWADGTWSDFDPVKPPQLFTF